MGNNPINMSNIHSRSTTNITGNPTNSDINFGIFPNASNSATKPRSVPDKCTKRRKCLLILIPFILLIIAAIVIIIVLLSRPKKKDGSLKNEFEINTKVGDLRRISVIQKNFDQTLINGELISTNITRKTNYDIYIRSEEESKEEDQLFYSKMYTGIVSISSECFDSEGNDCNLEKMVDLSSDNQNIEKGNNLRILEDIKDFKDIPIALCFFNITNNDFITSLTCPESLPEIKKNEIILDLYFFRPPAIQRADKENDNITISINEDIKNKKKYIREINGGLCNVYNNWGTECTTDMNTTLDLKNNLLSYDELAVTNIVYDEHNSFKKIKITKLNDITNKNINKKIYKKNLDKLLPYIKPYMKNDIQFTRDNFTSLYDLVQNKMNQTNYNKTSNNNKIKRSLSNSLPQYIKKKELFQKEVLGILINLNLKINSGINTDFFSTKLTISFDEEEHDLSTINYPNEISNIIKELSILTRAGNYMASLLYEEINEKLENFPNQISIKINTLKDLIQYYDLSEIFNSTLESFSINKIPIHIFQVSNILVSKLAGIYLGIRKDNVKMNVDNLVDVVYNHVNNSHLLVDNVYNNLTELENTFINYNNTYTEITNYYLNDTSSSFINIIDDAKFIFNNYFKIEYELIFFAINNLIKKFEDNSKINLDEEKNNILNIYKGLLDKSLTIDSISENDFQKVLMNLINSYNYTTDIISKIKNYIIEEINIKDSGYFVTSKDIKNKNETYYSAILKALDILLRLNNENNIDIIFDEIMINFRNNYTDIIKYMEKLKFELFSLEENILNETLFSDNDKYLMETELKKLCDKIIEIINNENNFINNKTINYLNQFLEENLSELNDIIIDLDAIYSEDFLQNLANAFENAVNEYFNKISYEMDLNYNLTYDYYNLYYSLIANNNNLKKLILNYKINEIQQSQYFSGVEKNFSKIDDIITNKERTYAYNSKYIEFISSFNFSKNYLNNHLYTDILNSYQTISANLKNILQSILDYKFHEKYYNLIQFEFYEKHINKIQKIFERIEKYFSIKTFNDKYSYKVKNKIITIKNKIDKSINYITTRDNYINTRTVVEDYVNDICFQYKRKICYGCTNCAWLTYVDGKFCLVLTPYENNYLKISKLLYNPVENMPEFKNYFNNFYEKVISRVNIYNLKMDLLENNLTNIKEETSNQNLSLNYLDPINHYLNRILKEKYGNEILKITYSLYYKKINNNFRNIMNIISDKWKNAFETLFEEIKSKNKLIKFTISEIGYMSEIIQYIVKDGVLPDYFNSIILFEKSEFDYTISSYYQYIYKLIANYRDYILFNIPFNKFSFNDIYNVRKTEIENNFSVLLENIYQLANESLNIEYQQYILGINKSDFFQINSFINDQIKILYYEFDDIIENLYEISMNIDERETEFSLVGKFYLENKELGRLITQIYKQVDEEIFFDLNLDKFKEKLTNNWIFESDDFINILNNALYETNDEIKNETKNKLNTYRANIEREITRFFNRDKNIENLISNLYLTQIKELNNTQINNIKNYIDIILDKLKEKFGNICSSQKYLMNETLDGYIIYITNYLDKSISYVLEEFYENMIKNISNNCIENKLDEYLQITKTNTSLTTYGEYTLLNSSYKIGELIYNLTEEVIENFKKKVRKSIYFRYLESYEKIKSSIDFEQIKNKISEKIIQLYNIYTSSSTNGTIITTSRRKKNSTSTCINYNNIINKDMYIEINNTIDLYMNKIKEEILLTKDSNFEIEYKCPLDFRYSGSNVIKPTCNDFKNFLNSQKDAQIRKINTFIQNTLLNDLDKFLLNVIPTFGNEFFERIIDYNINFKVFNLYDNLRYVIAQTIYYYDFLNMFTSIESLPADLKIRLYKLNDLDITIQNKKEKIIDLLKQKLNELINNLKNVAREKYKSYYTENEIIKNSFSPLMIDKIKNNLNTIINKIENNYNEILEKYLKEKFLKSFTDILNEKTDILLDMFYKDKKDIISKLDSLFSLETDKDLNEVNRNINNALESIREYYKFSTIFSIPGDIMSFFSSYSYNNILPLYQEFRTDLNNLTLQKIESEINSKAKEILNLNISSFKPKAVESVNDLELNYRSPIYYGLRNYTYPSYITNLDKERKKIRERTNKRRLIEDENNIKRFEMKDLGETLTQLKLLMDNLKKYNSAKTDYTNLHNIYYNNRNNLMTEYKNVKYKITKKKYENDVYNYLLQKLDQLYNIMYNHYNDVYNGKEIIRQFIVSYKFNDLYTNMNYCNERTITLLPQEYEKIIKNLKTFNICYSNNTNFTGNLEYTHKTEHMTSKVNAMINEIKQNSEFKLDVIYELGFIKTPIINVKIIDKTHPDKLILEVGSEFGFCGRTIYTYEINFNEVNYTMNIEYRAKTDNINITTYTNFEKYNYTTEIYQYPELQMPESISHMGFDLWVKKQCYDKKKVNLTQGIVDEVEKKEYNESMIILGGL